MAKKHNTVKITYTAKKEIEVDLSCYPDNATLDEILQIEKKNIEEYGAGTEFDANEVEVSVEF